jgi:hypothetical protein
VTGTTQGERLARIETLLAGQAEKQSEMAVDIKAIRQDLDADKADLAAIKNKGAGLLIGVGLLGGSFGATIAAIWARVVG